MVVQAHCYFKLLFPDTIIQGILKAKNSVFIQCAVAVYFNYIFVSCIILQNTDINFSVVITKECVRKTVNKTSYRETDKVYMLPFHSSYNLWLAECVWIH